MQRNELANVMACDRGCLQVCVVFLQQKHAKQFYRLEIVLLKLFNVLLPELLGVDEAPMEATTEQLLFVPFETCVCGDLDRDQLRHFLNVGVKFSVAPFLVLKLLHSVEDTILDNIL